MDPPEVWEAPLGEIKERGSSQTREERGRGVEHKDPFPVVFARMCWVHLKDTSLV